MADDSIMYLGEVAYARAADAHRERSESAWGVYHYSLSDDSVADSAPLNSVNEFVVVYNNNPWAYYDPTAYDREVKAFIADLKDNGFHPLIRAYFPLDAKLFDDGPFSVVYLIEAGKEDVETIRELYQSATRGSTLDLERLGMSSPARATLGMERTG